MCLFHRHNSTAWTRTTTLKVAGTACPRVATEQAALGVEDMSLAT